MMLGYLNQAKRLQICRMKMINNEPEHQYLKSGSRDPSLTQRVAVVISSLPMGQARDDMGASAFIENLEMN